MGRKMATILFLGILIGFASGQLPRDKEKQIKDSLMDRNYDTTLIPAGRNGTGPVHVNVSVFIKTFLAVDEKSQTMKLQLVLRMKWNDARLVYSPFPPAIAPNSITLDSSLAEKIWVPKVYFVNGLDKEMDKDNQFIRIFLDKGNVEYSSLVTLTTKCPMDLAYFPLDVNTCLMKISSYAHTSSDIVFNWDKTEQGVETTTTVPGYKLQNVTHERCDSVTPTGKYSCIQLEIEFKRDFSYYLIMIYIPCCMLVIASWLSYFLDPVKSATPRLVLAATALGLGVIGTASINLTLPQVTYTKAVDIYTGITLTFIFTSVVEFVFVNFCRYCGSASASKGKKSNGGNAAENAEQTPLNPDASGDAAGEPPSGSGTCGAASDIIFRIAIPIAWTVFLVLYWIVFV